MGDADEVSSAALKSPGDGKHEALNIDMVNLSCQLTSMGLRPDADKPGPSGRKAKKRVRFSLPDGEGNNKAKTTPATPNRGEPDATVPVGTGTVSPGSPLFSRMADKKETFRHREFGEFLKAKRRFLKSDACIRKPGDKESGVASSQEESIKDKVGVVASSQASGDDKDDDDDDYDDDDDEQVKPEYEEPKFKCSKKRKRENVDNVNYNCATKGKVRGGVTLRTKNSKRKRKSAQWLSKYKYRQNKRKVVSKKSSVRDNTCCVRYVIGDKRKVSEILKDFRALCVRESKKRKASRSDAKKRRKYGKSVKNPHSIKHQKLKSGSKCSKAFRAKLASVSAKRTRDRLKKAKAAKRKSMLLKKAKEARKKALKRKELLKRKLAQKRKAEKKAKAIKRRCAARNRRSRKVRIIPIWRDEDVSESLHMNLLKFLTFDKAYDQKLECCRRYCWDRWEELDMDDVIADFD